MAYDTRWPITWTVALLSGHLVASFCLLVLAARDLGHGSSGLGVWTIPQSGIVTLATISNIICVTFAKLNPGWALSIYLLSWLGWIATSIMLAFDFSDYIYELRQDRSTWGSYERSLFEAIDGASLTTQMVMGFICLYRRERAILVRRGLAASVELQSTQGPIKPSTYPKESKVAY